MIANKPNIYLLREAAQYGGYSKEYFGHKYNISNEIKDSLNSFAENLKAVNENKYYFNKDLEKNK